MGYYSDVRLIITKKGYIKLNEFIKEYIKNCQKDYDYQIPNLLNGAETISTYHANTEKEFRYFCWNYIKWYEEYPEVQAIYQGLTYLKNNNIANYEFARIGEDLDDYEEDYNLEDTDYNNLPNIEYRREFDDELELYE